MLEINGMKFPTDRKYYIKDGAHLWLKPEGDIIRIGMDAFGAEMTGLLTFLNISEKHTEKGDAIGSFESAKFVSRLYSPIKGEIIDVNYDVINNPRKINEDPYNSWIYTIKADISQLDDEFIIEDETALKEWIEEEFKRVEQDD